MKRWGVPLLVLGVLLAVAIAVALLPTKADDHDCGASAIAIVAGADVPEEHADECHEAARTEMLVAAFPAGAFLVGSVVTVALLRTADRKEE